MKNPLPWEKKVMREFDRGTRGWFLRKVVLGHGGGGYKPVGDNHSHGTPFGIMRNLLAKAKASQLAKLAKVLANT